MDVYLVIAENPHVAGLVTKVFARIEDAQTYAVELVNIILRDGDFENEAALSTWESALEALQEEHGAAHCYVDILKTSVVGD